MDRVMGKTEEQLAALIFDETCHLYTTAEAAEPPPSEGPAAHGVTEIDSGICDLCHRRGEVRYLDHDWLACRRCRERYIRRLYLRG